MHAVQVCRRIWIPSTAINFEHKEGCCNKPQSESLVMPHSCSPQALQGLKSWPRLDGGYELVFGTVALLFVFDNYYLIMIYLDSKDLSRNL